MKILFFIESLRSGGKERRLVELIKGLVSQSNIECELVLTRKDIHYTDIFDTNIKIHIIERRGLKKDPRLFLAFFNIAKKYSPDIIHVWGNMPAIYAIPTKLILRKPLINSQITDAPINVHKGLLSHKLTFRFSDIILANSHAGLNSYSAPKDKSEVIYNGFDFSRINNLSTPTEVRLKFGINTKHVVGMIASFSDKKDYFSYIKAAENILSNRNDITFLCVGAGNDLKYKELVNEANKQRILFLGRQKDVEAIMNICDVGVLLSNHKTHGEGISNSIMEFMAIGKPVIASDNGGNKELVLTGKTGFIVNRNNNLEEIVEKIFFFLEDKDMLLNYGVNSSNRIHNLFCIENMITAFITEYEYYLK